MPTLRCGFRFKPNYPVPRGQSGDVRPENHRCQKAPDCLLPLGCFAQAAGRDRAFC